MIAPRTSLRLALPVAVAATVHCLVPAAALAQSARSGPVVRPAGVEARVYAPQVLDGSPGVSPWFVGRLVDADSAGITLVTATGATVTIPRSYAQSFSVRVGAADRARSAWQGALAGAALGLLVGKVSAPAERTAGEPKRHMVNGSIVGVLTGFAFATFNPWHRWATGAVPTAVSGETR